MSLTEGCMSVASDTYTKDIGRLGKSIVSKRPMGIVTGIYDHIRQGSLRFGLA